MESFCPFKLHEMENFRQKKRLSNKFWAVSFYSFNRLKNKLKK